MKCHTTTNPNHTNFAARVEALRKDVMRVLRLTGRVIALLVGVGGLRYAATCDRGLGALPWLGYFVQWLPLTTILSMVILISLASRLKLNVFVISAVIGAIAWTQVIALWRDHNSQFAMSVMPLALVIIGVVSWACDLRAPSERAVKYLNGYGHWLLVGVALVVTGDLMNLAVKVQRGVQRLDESIAEEARKNRELKGIERAAWLISVALFPSEFSEEQFVRDQSCQIKYWGDFRWDNEQRRLIITQPVFDETTRRRLLPHADAVLEHPLLKAGARDDLQGGVLSCEPELACRIEWTIDVDAVQLNERSELHEMMMHNVDFVGRKLVQEFAP